MDRLLQPNFIDSARRKAAEMWLFLFDRKLFTINFAINCSRNTAIIGSNSNATSSTASNYTSSTASATNLASSATLSATNSGSTHTTVGSITSKRRPILA